MYRYKSEVLVYSQNFVGEREKNNFMDVLFY